MLNISYPTVRDQFLPVVRTTCANAVLVSDRSSVSCGRQKTVSVQVSSKTILGDLEAFGLCIGLVSAKLTCELPVIEL